MYKDLVGTRITVIVSSRAETLLEYSGVLYEEDEKFIKLKDAEISMAILNFQKNMFGSGINSYKRDLEEIILNKDYVISYNKE